MARSTHAAIRLRRAQRMLIDQLESTLNKGFQDSCQTIKDDTIMKQLVAAIADNDVEGAITALNIEPAAFRPYITALEYVWEAGGNLAANTMPKMVKKYG
jgi:hypothetical protein